MLKVLRGRMKGIVWVTIILVGTSFIVLYGGPGRARSRSRVPQYVGEVYGRKISFGEYRESFQWVKSLAIMQYGKQFDEVAKFLNLEKEAWDNIVLLKHAEIKGIKVGDEELASLIRSFPAFQKDGKFDSEIYRKVLLYVLGAGPAYFEDGMRREILVSKLRHSVTDCVKVTDRELRQYYRYANEKVRVEYMLFKSGDFEKEISLTEQQIRDYFELHRKEFMEPGKVRLQYVLFKPEDEEAGDDALDRIEEETEELLYMLEEGEMNWDELEEVRETEYIERGDAGSIPLKCVDAAFSLNIGETSALIRAGKGFYLLKLIDKRESYFAEKLENVSEKVEERLKEIEALKFARSKTEKCVDALKKNKSIRSVARKYSMKVIDTGFFTQNGHIKGLGGVPDFKRIAFSLTKSNPFGMAEIPSGFCVLAFTERQGFDEEKFEEDKENLYRFMLDGEKARVFQDWFWLLKERAGFRITHTFSPQTDKV